MQDLSFYKLKKPFHPVYYCFLIIKEMSTRVLSQLKKINSVWKTLKIRN